MRYLRKIGLAALAAMALTAVLGPGSASATEIYRFTDANVTQGVGTTLNGSLKSGSSLTLKTTSGSTDNTCTGSELATTIESPGGEASHPSGKVSTLAFSGCTYSTTVHAKGSLEVKHIAGTTNGTVTSSGMEVTSYSALFGSYINCKTSTGIDIGTLTGVNNEGGHATLDINAVINCGFFVPSAMLTGTYTITTPTGLNVEAAPKSGTELYKFSDVANETQGTGTTIEGSLKSGSSLLLQSTSGSTENTCTGSQIATTIESPGGEASHPSGKVSTLAFTGCNNNTTVHAKGSLEIKHIAGTTNGTVTSSGMEVTSYSATFGYYLNCKTNAGIDIGTLTGVSDGESHATLDINAVINCGFFVPSAILTGTYTITTPTGVNVEAAPKSGTEIYRFTDANVTQGVGTTLNGSLKSGSSLTLKTTSGSTDNTCTGSELATTIESPGGEASHPSGKVSTLAFSGCTYSTTVHAKGSLEVKHIAGTTNGTVTSSGMEVTSYSALFGSYINCKTSTGIDIGTLTGVNNEGGHATLDINAVINCGFFVPSAMLTGTYTITTPTGLNVEAK